MTTPHTGHSMYKNNDVDEVGEVVSATPIIVYGLIAHLNAAIATVNFLKLYNVVSDPDQATVVPDMVIAVEGSLQPIHIPFPGGINFNVGCVLRGTALIGDTDDTGSTLLSVNILYN